MKIMHIVTRWQIGGTERNVEASLRREAEAGHQLLLVVGGGSDTNALPDVPVAVIESLQREVDPRQDIRAILALRRLVRAWRPDVLHTHQSKAGILGRAVGGSVCVVHTAHMASFGPAYGAAGRAFRMAERKAARRTDVLVSVGEDLRDLLDSSGVAAPRPTLVVRSPVDVERFARHRADGTVRADWRQAMGLPAAARVIVSAGALEPRKRPDLAVRAAAPLLASDPSMRLLVAGAGPLAGRIADLAARLGVDDQVMFLGHRFDLDLVFVASDVLLHTAAAEGVPQVLVQAIAAGLPVVAVDVEGVGELARRAGSVRRVEADAAALGAALRQALDTRPPEVPLSVLAEWTAAKVDIQAARFLEVVGGIVGQPARLPTCLQGRVSVIVPTHGRPAQLRRALDSIAAQTSPPDEVVVVDDLDDPATAEVVAQAPGPVRRLVSTSTTGVSASRNLGLAGTTGELVAFLDDDDVWAPSFLRRARQALGTADAAVTWTGISDGRGESNGTSMPAGLTAKDVVAVNPGFTGSNVAYRRAALDRVKGFDTALRVSNDKDLLVRLLDAGLTYTVVPERLVTRGVGGHDRLGSSEEARLVGLQSYLDKHRERMSPAQCRYLQGRMERVRRRRAAPGWERIASTARMAYLLGPTGILQVRADDARSEVRR